MPLRDIYLDRDRADTDINANFSAAVYVDELTGMVALGEESVFDTTNERLGIGTTTPSYSIHVHAATPRVQFRETDAGTDVKAWGMTAASGTIFFFLRNDADTAGSNWLRVTRSGTTPVAISFENGQVAIGTATPNAAAKLQIESTTQGLLVPRMTTTQRDAISSPPDGLIIYNTTLNVFQGRTGLAGGSWVNL